MKLTVLTIALILLLTPYGRGVNRQDKSAGRTATQDATARIQELESRFKEIDKEPGRVEVKVTGDKETAEDARLRVVREVKPTRQPPAGTASADAPPPPKDAGPQEVTLLDLDLSGLDVPDEYINAKVSAAFERGTVGSLPGVKVRQIDATANYEVVEDYTYNSGSYSITAPKGFVYDRASIPRGFWVLIDKDSLSNVPPLFHDLLYRNGGVLPRNLVSPYKTFTRKETDLLFHELMGKCGVLPWRREAAYDAVRTLAWFAWKGH